MTSHVIFIKNGNIMNFISTLDGVASFKLITNQITFIFKQMYIS